MTIYISPVIEPEPEGDLVPIRASLSHKLAAHMGKRGIYFYDRFSQTRYLMTWDEIDHAAHRHDSIILQAVNK